MSTKVTEHAWSSEALFNKALLYVGEMERRAVEEWQFVFWSSLTIHHSGLSHFRGLIYWARFSVLLLGILLCRDLLFAVRVSSD